MRPIERNTNMIKTLRSTKKFVANHKVAVAITVTALTCLALNKSALKQHDKFLKEHGLLEKFYHPED